MGRPAYGVRGRNLEKRLSSAWVAQNERVNSVGEDGTIWQRALLPNHGLSAWTNRRSWADHCSILQTASPVLEKERL